jgi:small subunit ribosomal protein S14
MTPLDIGETVLAESEVNEFISTKRFRFAPFDAELFVRASSDQIYSFLNQSTSSQARSPVCLVEGLSATRTMPNFRVLRDMKARRGFAANEILRRAYLYIARNENLPPQARHQAQLQLNSFDRYARPTTVKNRCVESGRGRGIISEFGLSRVCRLFTFRACFRLIVFLVSISVESAERGIEWCKQGFLVIWYM